MRRTAWLVALVAGIALALAPAGLGANSFFTLTVLHNNDGESKLIDAGQGLEDYGGVARFKTVVDRLRAEATSSLRPDLARGVVMISSGDNFLAGPQFAASLEKGVPFYDSIAMNLIDYDAAAIGNHEFDFGPDVLADMIEGTTGFPWLSANLNFSLEPALQALVSAGRIAKSTVVVTGGERIGIVGATTPALATISSPRRVTVDPNVAGAIQAEVDALESMGVNKIILTSHLQSVQEDLALAPMLDGVDIMIAGGGDELLAKPYDQLVPGDSIQGPYPIFVQDLDGTRVPVITTAGDYKYVGRLVTLFDGAGNLLNVDRFRSGPVRVSGVGSDAVAPDPTMQQQVVEPVKAFVAELAATVIGTSEVPLDGRRTTVRAQESNEGNLLADAMRWQATKLAPDFGMPTPQIALQNGGGIRNNNIIPAGPFTELNTFDIAPFSNFVSIVPDVPAATFKAILENAVSRVEFGDGRFAQISGFRFTWDAAAPSGSRVRTATLDGGTPIIVDGAVVAGAPAIDVATIDFLARGGDGYPFGGAPFTTLGVTYQQALSNYVQAADGLAGVISAARYPVGGEGRITRLN